jgi:hypothetical protein
MLLIGQKGMTLAPGESLDAASAFVMGVPGFGIRRNGDRQRPSVVRTMHSRCIVS